MRREFIGNPDSEELPWKTVLGRQTQHRWETSAILAKISVWPTGSDVAVRSLMVLQAWGGGWNLLARHPSNRRPNGNTRNWPITKGVTSIDDIDPTWKPSCEDESAEEFSAMLRQWRREVTGSDSSQ